MTFWALLAVLVVGFGFGFYIVKSGRLTMYMLAVDGVLIKAEPIFGVVTEYDFADILTRPQQGWLVLVATVLAAVARKRRQIRETMGLGGAT